ncbi:MAG: 23S rRNA (adenine(1618)-N(6))-methyltransferase RlmF [Pedobacter sp.]|nr:MAG: 23S rRNA (adenine(1618)-N(6))-methyltransferase RlmF [Pedobacter sp.]
MSAEKTSLHPRNKHRERYDFPELIKTDDALKPFVFKNQYDDLSVDFSDPDAVRALNKALLKHFYNINHWDIPAGYLCPPIPGRADYIHYLADLLTAGNNGVVVKGKSVKGIDVGVGANCVYPIIGHQEYGWSFLGTDIDGAAVKAAKAIVAANSDLVNAISIRQQTNKQHIFNNITKPGELYDFTMCNPPFHASAADAQAGTNRKLHNLGKHKGKSSAVLNFGGKDTELWFEGGEAAFIRNMIMESKDIAKQCLWFTTLVSKSQNLPYVNTMLSAAVEAAEIRVVEMAQGQKISRFVAWTFHSPEEQKQWANDRWATKS